MLFVTRVLSTVAAVVTLSMASAIRIQPAGGGLYNHRLAPGKDFEDLELRFTGAGTRHLDIVFVTLNAGGRASGPRRQMHVPLREEGKDPPIRWTLCDSAFATSVDVQLKWRSGAPKDRNIQLFIQRKDTRLSEEDWVLKSALWEYRRLPRPVDGQYAGVSLNGQGPLPIVACIRDRCEQDVTAPSKGGPDCKDFTDYAQFPRVDGGFLYMKIKDTANIGDNGKSVNVATRLGSVKNITDWLSAEKEIASRPRASIAKQRSLSAPASPSANGHKIESQDTDSPRHRESEAAGARDTGADTESRSGVPTSNQRVSNGNEISQTVSGNIANPSANVNFYMGHVRLVPATQRSETAEETETPAATDGDARLGELVSDEVTAQGPGVLQFFAGPQGGPLTFEMTSDGPLNALLVLEPQSMSLDIASIRGGSDTLQLCQGQLKGGRLRVTVSTPAEGPVRFTARLHRSGNQLGVGKTKGIEVRPSHSNVSQLDFPDYDSPVALKVDLPPNTCMRASIFKKACKALAGRLKDAILHKYVSNGGYLPVTNPTDDSRRAFLRTDWASPERCGLPAAAAAAGSGVGAALGSLHAMFTVDKHEDEWMLVLLPPLAMAVALPALVVYLVRAAAARWRRGPPAGDDDDEVIITELSETPRFNDPDTGKPAVTAAPAPATPIAIGLVSEATGYPDLSGEKQKMAAQVAEQTRDTCPSSCLYPRLSDEQLREAAELEAEAEAEAENEDSVVEGGAKERLAARLGVGGCQAVPSAPAPAEDVSSLALLSGADDGRAANTAAVAGRSRLGQLQPSVDPSQLAVGRRLSPVVASLAMAMLAPSVFFSVTGLSNFFSGDVGACPVSAQYTLVSTRLPGFAGLANLVPAVAYVGCFYGLRQFWLRRAAPSLLKAGVVWPMPILGWLLIAYGVQGAIDGLCPGHNSVFASNTFAVAFVGAVAASQVPTSYPALPLAAAAGGSVLVSAAAGLRAMAMPALGGVLVTAVHVIGTVALCRRLLLPNDIGHLTLEQQVRLLDPIQAAVLCVPQAVAALLGALVLSPGGYLALSALAALVSVLATRRRKGTIAIRTPLSPYAWLSKMVGLTTFFVAIVIGEVSYYGSMGQLEASAVGELMYLVSCFALGLGIPPRFERLQ